MENQEKNEKRGAPNPEKPFDWDKEKREAAIEKKEISPDDKIISEELRREIELMETDENSRDEAKIKSDKIKFLGEDEKLEHLLSLAREKGVVFAIQVAKKMNEPFLLDTLHDALAKEGYYQKFTK
jgi:hypothetical protein